MNSLKMLVLWLAIMCTKENSAAQQAVVAAGGSAKTGEGSISFSMGQVVDGSITYSGYVIYEGVQQPYEIFIISSTKETDIRITLSPNPALDFIVLKTDKILENMSVRLYAADGKEVLFQKIAEEETTLPLDALTGSAYFLVIYSDAFQIKTYTIIKQ